MNSAARPIITALRGGSFATQAAAKTNPSRFVPSPQQGQLTRLPSGVVVASFENYSPVSRVAVIYGAGSRQETPEQLGITHCLRAASTLSSQKASAFLIAKQLQQLGGNLNCTTTRETVEYSVECLRSELSPALTLLSNVSTLPVFKPWEVSSLSRRLKLDLELFKQCPDARVMEALHKIAYRETLGNSIYTCEDNIGHFSTDALENFVKSKYISQNAVVVGVGVDHEHLLLLSRKMSFHQGPSGTQIQAKPAKYYGGEARIPTRNPLVHAALVTEGVSLQSPDLLPLALLQLSLGIGPFVKYSANTGSSKISKAAHGATSESVFAQCINLNYTDSGLFGVQVIAGKKDIRKVLGAVVQAMGQATKSSITDADLQRAKAQIKSLALMRDECASGLVESMGIQALFTGQLQSASSAVAAVDKITLDDVNKVAKKVINGKPSLSIVGDLSDAPYLDEIMSTK